MAARTTLAGRLLLLAAALLALAACGQEDAPETSPASRAPPPGDGDALFEEVTERAGIDFVHRVADGRLDDMIESVGSGAVWFDADGDGFLDLYLLQQGARPNLPLPPDAPPDATPDATPDAPRAETPATNRLFRNRGDGTFEDVTDRAGVGDPGFGFSAAAGDYDNDGDADLFVFNEGPNRLYRNRGDGTFEELGERAGIAGSACSVGGTLLDADGDGWLDLYVGNYLTFDPGYRLHYAPDAFPGPLAFSAQDDAFYLNQRDGTFRDATAETGLDVVAGRAMGVTAADFDGDGRPDIFVANDGTANFLLKNLGGGTFREVAQEAGVAYGFHGEATGAMAGSVGDFDDDGLPDLHVTDTRYGSLYRNLGGGQFQDRAFGAGVAAISGQRVSWGGGFLDVDNDGDLDLYLANGDLHHPTGRPDMLLENRGDGTFGDLSSRGGAYFRREGLSRGGCIGDYDNDGRVDVLVTNTDARPALLHNRSANGNHHVTLTLRGTRSNRDGLGAVVTLVAGGRSHVRAHHAPSGYLTQGDPRLHFGLGQVSRIERVTVRWPAGGTDVYPDLAVDRVHVLVEGQGRP